MFRVMTLNIWNLSGPWRERREEIAHWIERLTPDVVCLQEVVQSPDRDQATWLLSSERLAPLQYSVALGPGLDLGEGRRFGNAILSRAAIDASHCVPLPSLEKQDEGRVLLHAKTAGVDVFCTHLNWKFDDGDVRQAQVHEAVRAIEELSDPGSRLPPIFAGDFNAEPQSDEIRYLTGETALGGRTVYFQDAWRVAGGGGPGWTWDNRNPFAAKEHEPDRRIDYVFVGWKRDDGAGRIETARVVCDRALSGIYATDHYGVLADLAT